MAGIREWVVVVSLGVLAAAEAAAQDFHVCDCGTGSAPGCVAGDDGNVGSTPEAPWRTFERVRAKFNNSAQYLNPGDRVLFCRGGAFDVSNGILEGSNCSASDPCVIQDYAPPWGTGSEERPILTSAGSIFAFYNGGASIHDEGYVIRNLDLRGGGTGYGFRFGNDVDDVLMENLAISGFSRGVAMAGASNGVGPGSDGFVERITLRNSTVTNNPGQGWLGGCDGCVIENNYFAGNGATANFDHNIYLSGSSGRLVRNERIVGNRLTRATIVNGQCRGVSLVVHGEHEGLLIEGNTIWEDAGTADSGCWGIGVDSGYGAAEIEGFHGAVIRGNRIINMGNRGIGVSNCPDCLIENNVIIQDHDKAITGISLPDSNIGEPEDAINDNVTVRNNSIYVSAASNQPVVGIRLGATGTSHVVVGNVVRSDGSGAFDCFDLGLPASDYERVDHNVCYAGSSSNAEWEAGSGSLAAWRAATPFDDSSLWADPGFLSPAGPAYDLAVGAGSPAVGLVPTGLSTSLDILGRSRDAAPDAGAYEFGGVSDATPPAAPRGLGIR